MLHEPCRARHYNLYVYKCFKYNLTTTRFNYNFAPKNFTLVRIGITFNLCITLLASIFGLYAYKSLRVFNPFTAHYISCYNLFNPLTLIPESASVVFYLALHGFLTYCRLKTVWAIHVITLFHAEFIFYTRFYFKCIAT